MSYCIKQVELLQEAGRDVAQQLLPDAFELWFSSHDTGAQMTIVTKATPLLTVWRGSKWYSHVYEFNDKDHVAGLQPDFAFAKDAIDKYFADVQIAIDVAKRARAERQSKEAAADASIRHSTIERTKAALAR